MAHTRKVTGTRGEDLAVAYLLARGYRLLERNYRFERGEIDIVMEDGRDLVFVEVKARTSRAFGDPQDAVTDGKRRQLRKVAEGFVFERQADGKSCRFDVIAIRWERGEPVITHLENAF